MIVLLSSSGRMLEIVENRTNLTGLADQVQLSDTREWLLSEQDMELIDALQVNPRISWATLGAVLGLDPVTVARRWERLNSAGEAWTTIALGKRQLHTMCMAFIELECEAGAALDVAESLIETGHLITVQHVAGSYDLFVIAVGASLPQLADYLLADLPRVAGIRKVRTHFATKVFDASRRWRLRVLSRATSLALAEETSVAESTRDMDDIDKQLFLALSVDGRTPYQELASIVGKSDRTVQRRLSRLVATGDVDFRCDLARPNAGWHAAAVLWLQVPEDQLDKMGTELLNWPETRTCAAVAGPSNMLLTVGLHAVSDLHSLVSRLSEKFPYARVVDRQLVMRQSKLYGRVLDPTGRWTRVVPVDPWTLDS